MFFFATKAIKLTPQNLITGKFMATKRIKIVPAFRVWTKMTFRAWVVAELIRGSKSWLKVQFRNHFSGKASLGFTWTGNKDTIFKKEKILRTKSFFIVMFFAISPDCRSDSHGIVRHLWRCFATTQPSSMGRHNSASTFSHFFYLFFILATTQPTSMGGHNSASTFSHPTLFTSHGFSDILNLHTSNLSREPRHGNTRVIFFWTV